MASVNHPVILYDGVCGLCNRLVRMILRRDPAGVFHFAPLQGEFGRAVLARNSGARETMAGMETGMQTGMQTTMETMYLVLAPGTPDERLLSHSDAAVYILGRIRGPLRAARALGWLPQSLRDALYRFVARRRYLWFGRYEQCPMPEPRWKERFLD
jgi:predicted DCC family thiol-disulfide oxidoreductase YuxK